VSDTQTPIQAILDETPENLSIIFDEGAQNAILGHLLEDQKFFIQSLSKIQPKFFNNPFSHQLLDVELDLYSELKRFPTIVEIQNHGKIKAQSLEDQIRINEHLQICLDATKKAALNFLIPRLTDWLHQLLLKKFLRESLQKYGSPAFKNVFYDLDEVRRRREEFSYEDTAEIHFNNAEEYLTDSEVVYKSALPTGLKLLDEALLEGAINGSLLPGDTTCVMSPTDGGKTTFLMTVLCQNLLVGKDCLLITHEGKPTDLRERILCCCLTLRNLHQGVAEPMMNKMKLIQLAKTVEGRKILKATTDLIEDRLVYYPYNRTEMVIEDVIPIIRRQQEKRVTLRGKGFDLLVSDYPSKLFSRRGSQGSMLPHVEKGYIYDQFVQLAIEFNFHSLVAVQTNREGYKTNNRNANAENSRLLTIDDVADAYVISNLVTNFISINRSPVDAQQDRVTFYVCKSKNSKTGRAIVARSAYGSRITHDEALGSIAYDDSVTFGGEMELVMADKKNNGKVMLTDDILKFGVMTSSVFSEATI
jgi:hypothetical protein